MTSVADLVRYATARGTATSQSIRDKKGTAELEHIGERQKVFIVVAAKARKMHGCSMIARYCKFASEV